MNKSKFYLPSALFLLLMSGLIWFSPAVLFESPPSAMIHIVVMVTAAIFFILALICTAYASPMYVPVCRLDQVLVAKTVNGQPQVLRDGGFVSPNYAHPDARHTVSLNPVRRELDLGQLFTKNNIPITLNVEITTRVQNEDRAIFKFSECFTSKNEAEINEILGGFIKEKLNERLSQTELSEVQDELRSFEHEFKEIIGKTVLTNFGLQIDTVALEPTKSFLESETFKPILDSKRAEIVAEEKKKLAEAERKKLEAEKTRDLDKAQAEDEIRQKEHEYLQKDRDRELDKEKEVLKREEQHKIAAEKSKKHQKQAEFDALKEIELSRVDKDNSIKTKELESQVDLITKEMTKLVAQIDKSKHESDLSQAETQAKNIIEKIIAESKQRITEINEKTKEIQRNTEIDHKNSLIELHRKELENKANHSSGDFDYQLHKEAISTKKEALNTLIQALKTQGDISEKTLQGSNITLVGEPGSLSKLTEDRLNALGLSNKVESLISAILNHEEIHNLFSFGKKYMTGDTKKSPHSHSSFEDNHKDTFSFEEENVPRSSDDMHGVDPDNLQSPSSDIGRKIKDDSHDYEIA